MQPYIAAPLPPDLAEHMEAVLGRIRSAERPSDHRADGVELIIQLTDACLEYYFLRSVTVLGLGKVAQQATRIGLKTAMSGIAMFVRQVGKSMTDAQILQLTHMVEDLILEVPDEEDPAEPHEDGGEHGGEETGEVEGS
ncbi:MAG: hypothetical protein MI919_17755 [Holophagales bacterium]|nr:hypothetical protein [Holophagales bacterium]